jgi:hypothetical protein
MAKMSGVWININNPGRSAQEDLNLTVGGTILLTTDEVAKVTPGQLFTIRINVMDDDTFSDDFVHTDESFSVAVQIPPQAICFRRDCTPSEAEKFKAELRELGRNLLQGVGEVGEH